MKTVDCGFVLLCWSPMAIRNSGSPGLTVIVDGSRHSRPFSFICLFGVGGPSEPAADVESV